MTDKEQWLASLKPGDRVVRSSGFSFRDFSECTVDRTTPKQIIIDHGERFWKANGRLVGDTGYQVVEIVPMDDMISETLEREELRAAAQHFHKLPITTVRRILAVLKEAGDEQGKERK